MNRIVLTSLFAASMLTLLSPEAMAAGTALASGAFDSLYATLVDWTTGTLGRSIALVFLLVGLGLGIFRGSILGAVSSIGAAIALIIAPDIIEALMPAV